jgi:hypothetical protein
LRLMISKAVNLDCKIVYNYNVWSFDTKYRIANNTLVNREIAEES